MNAKTKTKTPPTPAQTAQARARILDAMARGPLCRSELTDLFGRNGTFVHSYVYAANRDHLLAQLMAEGVVESFYQPHGLNHRPLEFYRLKAANPARNQRSA